MCRRGEARACESFRPFRLFAWRASNASSLAFPILLCYTHTRVYRYKYIHIHPCPTHHLLLLSCPVWTSYRPSKKTPPTQQPTSGFVGRWIETRRREAGKSRGNEEPPRWRRRSYRRRRERGARRRRPYPRATAWTSWTSPTCSARRGCSSSRGRRARSCCCRSRLMTGTSA
ncbi:unnamed protein product [Musa acuminata subsp. burmannicoides]